MALLAGDNDLFPESGVKMYRSHYVDGLIQCMPFRREMALPQDVMGYLYWGLAARYLGLEKKGLPPLDRALEILSTWYELDTERSLPDPSLLEAYIPTEWEDHEKRLWKKLLAEGMQGIFYGSVGEESFSIEKQAAGCCETR
jgi:hypothetical protein